MRHCAKRQESSWAKSRKIVTPINTMGNPKKNASKKKDRKATTRRERRNAVNDTADQYYTDKEYRRRQNAKMLKHPATCDECKTQISKSTYNRNGGYCGVCVRLYY